MPFEFLAAGPGQCRYRQQVGDQPPGGAQMSHEMGPAELALVVEIHRERQNQEQHDLAGVRPARPEKHQRGEHEGDGREHLQARNAQRPVQIGRRAPKHHHADRHDQVGDDGGNRDHGGEFPPAAKEKQEDEGHQQVEPHRGPRYPEARVHPAQYLGYGGAALHGVNHAGRGRGVRSAGAAGADECIGVKQQSKPVQVQRQRQLRKRRAIFQRCPPLV